MLRQKGGSCEYTAAQHYHLQRHYEHLWKMRRVLGSSEPLAGRNARTMQHIDVAGSAAISPGGEVCDSQAALGVLAQIPANTMQLDTMICIAVLSIPVKTGSTIPGIVAKKRARVRKPAHSAGTGPR